ncbi:hypothetical protein HYV21_00275 [Candidatus Microgenomates bacterium]|nr:hypothetical protein [Candidatus Microgenomates bacterium]
MRKIGAIGERFLRTVRVVLLLLGLPIAWITWTSNAPYSYTTYSYEVICDNGKRFDPTSKPIDPILYNQKVTFRTVIPRDAILSFDEDQVKSECEYSNAWSVGLSSKLPNNFQLHINQQTNTVRSQTDQVTNTIIVLVGYYLILEVARRTILYIFLGKSFLAK